MSFCQIDLVKMVNHETDVEIDWIVLNGLIQMDKKRRCHISRCDMPIRDGDEALLLFKVKKKDEELVLQSVAFCNASHMAEFLKIHVDITINTKQLPGPVADAGTTKG